MQAIRATITVHQSSEILRGARMPPSFGSFLVLVALSEKDTLDL
jgi:hypothetical protein